LMNVLLQPAELMRCAKIRSGGDFADRPGG
jgi:hypothetical protein